MILTAGHVVVRSKGLKLLPLWEDGLCALQCAISESHCLRRGKIGQRLLPTLGCWDRKVWPRERPLKFAYVFSISSSTNSWVVSSVSQAVGISHGGLGSKTSHHTLYVC